MIEQASLVIGNDNFAVKENSFLGYAMNQGFYVPREMDVVRATTATLVNSDGLIEPVAYNLYLRSEEFDNASWVKSNATVTANATNSPIGNLTSDKVIASATTSTHFIVQQPAGAVSGVTATISIFAKASELSRIQLLNNGGGLGIANYNLSTGTSTLVSGVSASIENYGNGWYRCIMSYIPTITGSYNIQIRLSDNSGNTTFLGNGTDGLFLWGAQLVTGSTAKTYFPTTDRLDVPRVDYSNGTPSILVEPQRTNLVTYSEEFENAVWGKANLTVTSNVTTSPNGTINADRIIENAIPGQKAITRGITIASGQAVTYSIYLKMNGRNSTSVFVYDNTFTNGFGANFNLSTGVVALNQNQGAGVLSSSLITNVGNGWYRCSISGVVGAATSLVLAAYLANGTSTSYTGDGVSGVFIWGAQCELGSNATSYIPTVAASVTRNADLISKTGISNLIGQTEGTIFFDFNLTKTPSDANGRLLQLWATNDTTNAIIPILNQSNQLQISMFKDSSGNAVIPASSSTLLSLGRNKIAVAYTSTTLSVYRNGVLFATGNPTSVFPSSLNSLNLGCSSFANRSLENTINSAILFKTRLTNSELAQLTTI